MRLLAWLAAVSACARTTLPDVAPAGDPVAHELYLVAFGADNYLAVERAPPKVELVAVWPESRRRTRFADVELDPWPEDLIEALRASDTGAAIRKLGFDWPQSAADDRERLETRFGTLTIDGQQVRLNDGELQTTVAELPAAEPSQHAWQVSRDGRWAALSLAYPGPPSVRDLRVIALERAAGQLKALRAFEHHQREEYAVALALWEEAVRLDPRSPRSHYNLACAHARLAHAEAALSHLRTAIALGGDRFRVLATRDRDFDSLRGGGALEETLRHHRPRSNGCAWEIPAITCD